MPDEPVLAAERVRVHVSHTGASVIVDGRDVAAFAWVGDLDIERWALDYAAAIRRHIDGRITEIQKVDTERTDEQ